MSDKVETCRRRGAQPSRRQAPLPWFKDNTADWSRQTRGLSLELKGLYHEIRIRQWELRTQLPMDCRQLRGLLGVDVRTINRLIPRLVAEGLLIETATGFFDPCLMLQILGVEILPDSDEFRPVSLEVDGPSPSQPETEFEDTFGELQPEVGENFPKNPVISTRDLEGEQRDREVSIPARKEGSLVDRSETRRYPRASDRPLADPETAPASLVIRRSGPPWPSGRMPDPSWPDHTGWAMADQHGDEVPQ